MLAVEEQPVSIDPWTVADAGDSSLGEVHVIDAEHVEHHHHADRKAQRDAGEEASDAVVIPLPLPLKVRQLDLALMHPSQKVAEGVVRTFEGHASASSEKMVEFGRSGGLPARGQALG